MGGIAGQSSSGRGMQEQSIPPVLIPLMERAVSQIMGLQQELPLAQFGKAHPTTTPGLSPFTQAASQVALQAAQPNPFAQLFLSTLMDPTLALFQQQAGQLQGRPGITIPSLTGPQFAGVPLHTLPAQGV